MAEDRSLKGGSVISVSACLDCNNQFSLFGLQKGLTF